MTTALPSRLLIDGRLVEGRGQARSVINPASEQLLAEVHDASTQDVEAALVAAERAWPAWASRSPFDRASVLRRIADAIDRNAEWLRDVLIAEVGKPRAEAAGEIGGTAAYFSHAASLLETQTDEIRYAPQGRGEIWTRRKPHGVVAAIIPWNFPSALVSRKVGPALAAGNAIVLKADEKTPLSALAIAQLLAEVEGLPAGVVNIVVGEGPTVGRQLVTSPKTRFVTMTGSGEAGRAILADTAPLVRPVSLELGGKAPFIVLPDADLEKAVEDAVTSRYMNCGQVCIANERTFVHADLFDDFVEAFVARTAELVLGDPADARTDLGPKISAAEVEKTLRIVEASVDRGATLRLGGKRPPGAAFDRGFWIEPTVITGTDDSMPVMVDEVFGPVAPITSFTDWAEAAKRANSTRYGLSAYVYTRDLDLAMNASRDLAFGEVYINRVGPEEVNGFHIGYGDSGLGGDDGAHGLDLYSRRQTTYIGYPTGSSRA